MQTHKDLLHRPPPHTTENSPKSRQRTWFQWHSTAPSGHVRAPPSLQWRKKKSLRKKYSHHLRPHDINKLQPKSTYSWTWLPQCGFGNSTVLFFIYIYIYMLNDPWHKKKLNIISLKVRSRKCAETVSLAVTWKNTDSYECLERRPCQENGHRPVAATAFRTSFT